jgi:hypothetical protein
MATRTRRGARAEAPATTAETASVQEDTNMSDINETPENATAEGTEAEAGTAEAGHTFNIGDEARVIRGKLRGRNGKILAFNEADKTYAITLDGGTLAVVNAGNLKAPADSTVSIAALVGVLHGFPFSHPDDAQRFASALDAVAPGVSAKLNEASASA